MFGRRRKNVGEVGVSVVLVPEVKAVASAASFPRDRDGAVIFMDDVVEYSGARHRVVAMSHKDKVVVRPCGQKSGGRWVRSSRVSVVERVLGDR